jgi:transposase
MKILALDLGKYKTVFCDYVTPGDGGGGEARQCEYGKAPTTPKDLHDLLAERRPDRLVLEAGPAAGWVHDLAKAAGVPEVQVANTNDERWHWKRAKKKTDRVDALKLAQMSAMGCLPVVHVPAAGVRQWRSLIEYRHALVDRRTAVKNSIRAIFDRQGLRLPSGHRAWTAAGVAQIGKDARPLAECEAEELWRGQLHVELEALAAVGRQVEEVEAKLDALAAEDERVKRLRTAPCVGPRLSEVVAAVLDDPRRFRTGKQVGAYAGLSPRQWQSGNSCRDGHVSRAGHPVLRELLVEVSWLGVRAVPWMKEAYERVRRGSDKRKKIAIVAVARRLLVRLWAMLRDGTDWRDDTQWRDPQPAAAVPA